MASRKAMKYVRELVEGDHTALDKLIDTLMSDDDPRGLVIQDHLTIAMHDIANHPGDNRYLIARWQSLCLLAVRIMSPAYEQLIAHMRKPSKP